MKQRRRRRQPLKYLLTAGTFLALAGMLINPRTLLGAKAPQEACQEMIQPQAFLSREQLARLLVIPERSDKAKVRQVMKEPYCKLANLEVRAGVKAEREAYPLAFDAHTWLVVLYEGKEYVGYGFSFRR